MVEFNEKEAGMKTVEQVWEENKRIYPSDKQECAKHILRADIQVWCNHCSGRCNDADCVLPDIENKKP